MQLDQQQAGQQQQDNTDQKAAADDAAVAVDPEHDQTVKKVRDAQALVDLLSKKKNRTMADEAKLKSASLIVSKNK